MVQHLPPVHHTLPTPHPDEPKTKGIDEDEGNIAGERGARARPEGDSGRPAARQSRGWGTPSRGAGCGGGAVSGAGTGAGGSRSSGRGRGILRRLRLRWLTARWVRRVARRLAAIYLAALAGPAAPPGAASSTCPPWLGLEPCFATPFVASARPC